MICGNLRNLRMGLKEKGGSHEKTAGIKRSGSRGN